MGDTIYSYADDFSEGRDYLEEGGGYAGEGDFGEVEGGGGVRRIRVDFLRINVGNKTDFEADYYPFNEQVYYIINLAIGGNFPGSPNAATIFPRCFCH